MTKLAGFRLLMLLAKKLKLLGSWLPAPIVLNNHEAIKYDN
jgi:hypothetical protein